MGNSQQICLITERFNKLKARAEDTESHNNLTLRQIYVELELLKLDIEEGKDALYNKSSKEGKSATGIISEINQLQSQLKLKHAPYKRTLLNFIDELLRVIAVWSFLMSAAVFLVIPCLIIMPLEGFISTYILRLKKKYYLASYLKVWISQTVLLVAGINNTVQFEVEESETFKDKSIVCFSHGSTMDAFLITGSIKCNNYTLV